MDTIERSRRPFLDFRFENSIDVVELVESQQNRASVSDWVLRIDQKAQHWTKPWSNVSLLYYQTVHIHLSVCCIELQTCEPHIDKTMEQERDCRGMQLRFSLLAFIELVNGLLILESNPIPEWPQLISINSVVSPFSLTKGLRLALYWRKVSRSQFQWLIWRGARKRQSR